MSRYPLVTLEACAAGRAIAKRECVPLLASAVGVDELPACGPRSEAESAKGVLTVRATELATARRGSGADSWPFRRLQSPTPLVSGVSARLRALTIRGQDATWGGLMVASMHVLPTTIRGCYELRPQILTDERGQFVKTFSADEFAQAGLNLHFAEEYYTVSRAGVLRGLHFQTPPMEHTKLVYCIAGSVIPR